MRSNLYYFITCLNSGNNEINKPLYFLKSELSFLNLRLGKINFNIISVYTLISLLIIIKLTIIKLKIMKSLKVFSIILAASIAFSFVFTSCKKKEDNTQPKTQSYRSAQDNSTAQSLFSGVFSQIQSTHAKVNQSKSTDTVIYGVPVITITPGGFAFPKTVTLDYGTTYSLCSDYSYRKGKIISTISAPYHDS
jgi:hypothetical protein